MEQIHSVYLDANESQFFSRALEVVKVKTYDIIYPDLKALSLIPIDTSAGPGAQSITYRQYDAVGMAKIIASYADDLPRVDLIGKEFSVIIKSLGDSFGYSIQDIRSAMLAGIPLEQRKANVARRAMEQEQNRIAWYGDAAYGLNGLLTHPNVTTGTVLADGAGGLTTWASKTPEQRIRDVTAALTAMSTLTKGREKPNVILLPTAQYARLATEPMTGLDVTTLEFLQKVSPGVQIEEVPELAFANAPAELGWTTDRMLIFNRDPDKLALEIPQPFEQFPAQERGLEFVVPCHSRIAGVIVYYPLSVVIMNGL